MIDRYLKFTLFFIMPMVFIFAVLFIRFESYEYPDEFTPEGYCVVKTKKQQHKGLLRFKNKNEFLEKCNGKMIFDFKDTACREFTMKGMMFDIYIEDDVSKKPFLKTDKNRFLCGKRIIETLK